MHVEMPELSRRVNVIPAISTRKHLTRESLIETRNSWVIPGDRFLLKNRGAIALSTLIRFASLGQLHVGQPFRPTSVPPGTNRSARIPQPGHTFAMRLSAHLPGPADMTEILGKTLNTLYPPRFSRVNFK
jgi:hypothetical protein